MNVLLTFIWVSLAMIAHSFWEAYIEGRDGWAKNSIGFKIKITERLSLTGYHFFLFFIELPMLFALPLIVNGWNLKVFGLLVSAFFFGIVLEDFFWFIVNPLVKLKEFNPEFVNWYPWLKLGKLKIPVFYIIGLLISFLSWYFIWR